MNQGEQNTYQLEPKEDERFYPSKVEAVIKQVFEEKLEGATYNVQDAHLISEQLTSLIRSKIKSEKNRYKLAIKVIYGEKKGQGIKVTSKCLWDVAFDNYATYEYQNEQIFAVGIVYGCYYE